ncbi:unnamed protein product [Blepharisma stoltei]|uniref:Uncharacterized protein n=1 Tax=Blepharisma stoltei TaxID=1481888 RepID=A0AAU9IQU2_9CILI|nr:unnamed protein product [Blepharisma stoltei]
MGTSFSSNCGCMTVFASAWQKTSSMWSSKSQSERPTILEEDDTHSADLLSEQEIQRLLNESQDYYNSDPKNFSFHKSKSDL